jgi:hypothetical protein
MKWFKRTKSIPSLQLGDEVRVNAMGYDYVLVLSDVTVGLNSPTTAQLISKDAHMNRIVIHRD